MANICSVDLFMEFTSHKAQRKFLSLFSREIKDAEKRCEGVKFGGDTWLFDAVIEETGTQSVSIKGWVKWALSHSAIQEFVERCRDLSLQSLECEYEEAGNMIYGKYEYHNGELWDTYLDESHPAWEESDWDDDDYFDNLERALENDGITVAVA